MQVRTISIAVILWSSAAVAQVPPPPQLPPRPPPPQIQQQQQPPPPVQNGRRPQPWADMMSDMVYWYRTLGVGGESAVNDPVISGQGNEDLWTAQKPNKIESASDTVTVSRKKGRVQKGQ